MDMQHCETIKELRKEFAGVKTGVAGDTIFGAKALMFIAEILASGPKSKKRKPSAWQKFLGRALKSGKTVKQAANEWKARNQ